MSDLGYPWDDGPRPLAEARAGERVGLRPDRPDERAAGLRHGGPGPGRGDEHHRPGRRRADAGRHLDRRHHGRPVRRHRGDRRPPPARRLRARGRMVDVAMLDCQVAILENAIARYVATGVAPGPLGSRHPSITPFGAFRAADGMVILAAGNDTLFGRLWPTCSARPSSPPTRASPPTSCGASTSPSSGPPSRRGCPPRRRHLAGEARSGRSARRPDQRRRRRAQPPAGPRPQHGGACRRSRAPRLPGGRQPHQAVHARGPSVSAAATRARRRPRRHPHRAASSTERPEGRETAGIHVTAAHGLTAERRF